MTNCLCIVGVAAFATFIPLIIAAIYTGLHVSNSDRTAVGVCVVHNCSSVVSCSCSSSSSSSSLSSTSFRRDDSDDGVGVGVGVGDEWRAQRAAFVDDETPRMQHSFAETLRRRAVALAAARTLGSNDDDDNDDDNHNNNHNNNGDSSAPAMSKRDVEATESCSCSTTYHFEVALETDCPMCTSDAATQAYNDRILLFDSTHSGPSSCDVSCADDAGDPQPIEFGNTTRARRAPGTCGWGFCHFDPNDVADIDFHQPDIYETGMIVCWSIVGGVWAIAVLVALVHYRHSLLCCCPRRTAFRGGTMSRSATRQRTRTPGAAAATTADDDGGGGGGGGGGGTSAADRQRERQRQGGLLTSVANGWARFSADDRSFTEYDDEMSVATTVDDDDRAATAGGTKGDSVELHEMPPSFADVAAAKPPEYQANADAEQQPGPGADAESSGSGSVSESATRSI